MGGGELVEGGGSWDSVMVVLREFVAGYDARVGWLVPRSRRRAMGAAPGDARAHRAGRDAQHLGDLRVVEVAEVAQHHRRPELLGQLGEGGVDRQPVGEHLDPGGRGGADSLSPEPRSSGRPGAGRRWRRRSSSRQALVATRYAQVEKAARPSKRRMPRAMAISASWVASRASASLPASRRHTA